MSNADFMSSRRRFLIGGAFAAGGLLMPGLRNAVWAAGSDAPEKRSLRVGFIPLTDCAPLVMAALKGFDKNMASACSCRKRRAGRRCATSWPPASWMRPMRSTA